MNDLLREERAMTDERRRETGSFIVVNLDRVRQSAAHIESILAPLGIPVEVVESGRQLRWSSAVVLRIPEHRIPDAMLALEMKGFADVTAYQSP
jgi:hypothetical protein